MAKVKVDENMFWTIKTLTKGGASIQEIAEFLKISVASVSRVRAAETLQEYRNQMTAIALECKARKQAAEKKPEENPPAPVKSPEKAPEEPKKDVLEVGSRTQYNYVNNRVIEELKAQNEYLKLISAKLAALLEAIM